VTEEILTLKKLEDMELGKIFKFTNSNFSGRTFMYVAKKGGTTDWAIYTSLGSIAGVDFWAGEQAGIAAHGTKLLDKKLIKQLVPCTDEAFGRYRF